MSEGMLAAVAGVAAVFVTLAQWYFSARAASRQRDVEMTQWGHEVIDVMAEIETASFPLSPETKHSPAEIEKLSERASALVDKGRWFFPNVKPDEYYTFFGREITWLPVRATDRISSTDEGIRVEILDYILKACYVARQLAGGGDGDRRAMRAHVWEARGSFVSLLQDEMGSSLRRKGQDSMGDQIDKNPNDWSPPTRPLGVLQQT